jgi:uncharacterized protein (DUF433 family)
MAIRWQDYIEQRPDVLLGKPVFKGTQLGVERILNELATGMSQDVLLANYPTLSAEHIEAAKLFAPGWDSRIDLEIPAEIEDQYEGKWIAWDTETSCVVASGNSMDEVVDRAAEHYEKTRHLIWYHNVLPKDVEIIGGLF